MRPYLELIDWIWHFYNIIEINWPFCFLCRAIDGDPAHDQPLSYCLPALDVWACSGVWGQPGSHSVSRNIYTNWAITYLEFFVNLPITSAILLLMVADLSPQLLYLFFDSKILLEGRIVFDWLNEGQTIIFECWHVIIF